MGDSLQFFINDTLVWSGNDNDFASGHIALSGYSEFGETVHYFDDVMVVEPETTSLAIGQEQQSQREKS